MNRSPAAESAMHHGNATSREEGTVQTMDKNTQLVIQVQRGTHEDSGRCRA